MQIGGKTSRSSTEGGFTLMEVVVALAIFGLLAGAAFGVLQSAQRAMQTGSTRALESHAIQIAVERFKDEARLSYTSRTGVFCETGDVELLEIGHGYHAAYRCFDPEDPGSIEVGLENPESEPLEASLAVDHWQRIEVTLCTDAVCEEPVLTYSFLVVRDGY